MRRALFAPSSRARPAGRRSPNGGSSTRTKTQKRGDIVRDRVRRSGGSESGGSIRVRRSAGLGSGPSGSGGWGPIRVRRIARGGSLGARGRGEGGLRAGPGLRSGRLAPSRDIRPSARRDGRRTAPGRGAGPGRQIGIPGAPGTRPARRKTRRGHTPDVCLFLGAAAAGRPARLPTDCQPGPPGAVRDDRAPPRGRGAAGPRPSESLVVVEAASWPLNLKPGGRSESMGSPSRWT